MRRYVWIGFGILLLGWNAVSQAAVLSVLVTGFDGKPVRDAVVVAQSGHPVPETSALTQAVLDQRGKEFHPWVSVVRTGTLVLFDNHDDITHHVYSFSPPKQFSFRLKAGEQRGPLPFDKPGVVVVGCNIHDWMIAYIYVTDSPYYARTDDSGLARIEDLPAGPWKVVLWHPGLGDTDVYDQAITVAAGDTDRSLHIQLRHPLTVTGPQPPLDNAGYP